MSDEIPAEETPAEPLTAPLPQAPPTKWAAPPVPGQDYGPPPTGGMDRLIPTRNPMALIGYYFGVFGLACWVLSPVAFVLGILGLKAVKKDPALPGKAHAWVAIVLGTIGTLILVGGGGIVVYSALRSFR